MREWIQPTSSLSRACSMCLWAQILTQDEAISWMTHPYNVKGHPPYYKWIISTRKKTAMSQASSQDSIQFWQGISTRGKTQNLFSSQFASLALIMSTAAAAGFDSCYNTARQSNFSPRLSMPFTHTHTHIESSSVYIPSTPQLTAMIHH